MDGKIGDINLCVVKYEHNLILQCCKHRNPPEHIFCKLDQFFCDNVSFDFTMITVLDLSYTHVLTQLPNSVRDLNLKVLALSHNQFKEVPSCLYTGLKNLEFLDLSHNFLTSFDIEPACVKKIKSVKINNNHLYNFPQWILYSSCLNLREFDYSRNFMVHLNQGQRLFIQKLVMRNDQLVDEDFKFFKSLRALTFLDIGNDGTLFNENRFKDLNELFKRMKWRHLKILILNHITLSIVPKDISLIISLTELHLVDCDLNWIWEEIALLTKLEILDVSDNAICSLPSSLTSLPKLRIIKAPNNNISAVHDFTSPLEILDLYSNYLEGVTFNIDPIEYIDLEENYFSTSVLKNYQSYTEKRDKLRAKFMYNNRQMGIKVIDDEPQPLSDNEATSEDSGEGSVANDFEMEIENECWDEVSPEIPHVRNPEVTPSDDEWDGKIEIRTIKKKPDFSVCCYDVDEDRIFCDVEQD